LHTTEIAEKRTEFLLIFPLCVFSVFTLNPAPHRKRPLDLAGLPADSGVMYNAQCCSIVRQEPTRSFYNARR